MTEEIKPKLDEQASSQPEITRKDPVMEELDISKVTAAIKVFLGTGRANYERMEKLIGYWLSFVMTRENKNAKPSEVAALKANLEEYAKEAFSNFDEDEVNVLASDFYNFISDLTETEFYRNKSARKETWANLTTTDKTPEGVSDVRGIKPSKSDKFSMADAMRRSVRRSKGEAENYSIILRNSFIHIRIARPTIIELSQLLENVNREIVGYVRNINGNSLTLARVSIMRCLWRFVADRITWCSVKDTQNYYDLVSSIKTRDMAALAVGLMAASTNRGVDLALQHQSEHCQWSAYKRVDPTLLIHHDDEHLTPDQHEAITNLINMSATYSREEIRKLQDQSDFGLNLTLSDDQSARSIKLKDPTLLDSFVQFDAFVERVRPTIQELRSNIANEKDYQDAVSGIISSVNGAEYAHWVDELILSPEPGSDDQPEVFKRSEDREGFSKGIYNVLTEDSELATKLVKFVRQHGPELSFTMVGVPNYICGGCGRDTTVDNEGMKGITPIDPLMAFFTHTQLIISETIRRGVQAGEEAL